MPSDDSTKRKKIDQTIEVVDKGMDILEDASIIKKDCGDFLREATDKEVEKTSALKNEIDDIVDKFVTEQISLATCMRKIEKAVVSHSRALARVPKEIADFLSKRAVLTQGHDGYIFTPPFWPYMYKILNYDNHHRIEGGSLELVNSAVRWIVDQMRAHDMLRKREDIASALSSRVGKEPAIMFSNTPAIFNPFEFEFDDITMSPNLTEVEKFEQQKKMNYTRMFADTLKTASSPVIYVWNKQEILKQIMDQQHYKKISIEELRNLYYNHFQQYASQPNIAIYWGDNSEMTNPERSLQYISEKNLVIGGREEKKMAYGVLINRKKLRAKIRVVLSVAVGLSGAAIGLPALESAAIGTTFALLSDGTLDALLGADSYIRTREMLVDNAGYVKLSGQSATGLVNTVFNEITSDKG